MKKITKLLLMTAIAIGMVACSNDDNLPDAPDANAAKGNTYASISIKLPKGPSTRALPEDYNDKGTWEGIDAIETITVFLVNETLGTIDHSTFNKDTFTGITGSGTLKPTLAVKATPGEKVKAYIVLNGLNSDILGALKTATPTNFDDKYNDVISEVASKLASNDGTKDDVMMTNTEAPAELTIVSGVTEIQAKEGTGDGKNRIEVKVERVVSRAIVTAKADAKKAEIKVKNAQGTDASTITIKDLKYVVGQSNKQFYMIKRDNYVTPDAVYNFVPTAETWMAAVKGEEAIFDNTGLTSLTEVKTATGGTSITQFETALKEEGTDSKFVLPVTHEVTDAINNYRKGNTTYFEVIAIFTPNLVGGATYKAGANVFLGMNDGLFYSTRASAEASGQKATMYKGTGTAEGVTPGAIMKYVLWLNPNEIPGAEADEKATMSPTVRNQVYHAHIKGFKQIGLPNNPLNPNEPDVFGDNPINPIKPTDPLQTEDTYLSVQITVLPWGIHSYEINLGNYY